MKNNSRKKDHPHRNRPVRGLAAGLFFAAATSLPAAPATEEGVANRRGRPTWDQARAVEVVKGVLAREEPGDFAWDKIPWMTDPAEAAALARKEDKPLFVYLYLKKNVGPVAAPC